MNALRLSYALTEIDEHFLTMADLKEKEIQTMNRKPIQKKMFSSILIAAVLISLFTVTAFAVSSIHNRTQEGLREELLVEENDVQSYSEYPLNGDREDGVTLLSAINDGEFQKIYLDVSPVSREELQAYPESRSFLWTAGGGSGLAMPRVRSDRHLSDYGEIKAAIMEDAYDEESKTLTLECDIPVGAFEAGEGKLLLTLALCEETRELKSFGTVEIKLTETEARYFDFGDIAYIEETSGKKITLVGLELTPVSGVWKFRFENDEQIFASRDQEKLIAWGTVEDRVCSRMQIRFANGEVFSVLGTMTADFKDGAVECGCGWNQTINIREIESITLDELTLWEK